jgi:hypothetical protein
LAEIGEPMVPTFGGLANIDPIVSDATHEILDFHSFVLRTPS